MTPLIVDTTNPDQNGLLVSFYSQGLGIEQDFVRGDIKWAFMHRPVMPTIRNAPNQPWDDDFQTGDTFQVAIGNPDEPPTGGTFTIGVQRSTNPAITSVGLGEPATVTCISHGMASGDYAFLSWVSGTVPDLNGIYFQVSVINSDSFTIPVENTGSGGTGGTLTSFNTNGLTGISWNILAATLTTLLSATTGANGYGAVTVTTLNPGEWKVVFGSAGAVPNFYVNGSLLDPACAGFVASLVDGNTFTQSQQLIQLTQQPVAYCEPSTLLPAAAITATITTAGAAGPPPVNKLYALTMTSGTYSGTFSVTLTTIAADVTTFISAGTISAQDFQNLLSTASGMTAADVAVTRVGDVLNVQFQGTQSGSNVPTLSVTNIDMLAPKGVTGMMDLNTTNLYLAFAQTTANTLPFTFAIRRTRTSGEQSEYFQHSVILKRNIINVATLVPLALPAYYTQAQVDALLTLKANMDSSGNVLVGTKGRFLISSNGFTIQVSTDGSTWQTVTSYMAT